MKKISIEQITLDEKNVEFQPNDSFILSYPEFVAYFANKEEITRHNLIIAANFTFGWMPTKLEFKAQDFPTVISILNKVKGESLIGENELRLLRDMLYHSLVGASKLLHFINPHLYAIIDKHVYKYINDEEDYDQLNEPGNYLTFLDNCKGITSDERFEQIHISMNRKIGYEVTPYRAVELVMFVNGSKLINSST